MRTPQILMCPPDFYGIEYEINPWMNREVESDRAAAAGQWRALHDLLIDLGVKVETLEPAPGLPDLVFTANAGLVWHRTFISSRFRHEVRQRETPLFDRWAWTHGYEVVSTPEGHHFEGAGDALFVGETLYAGYRYRSDVRSHQWVADRIGVEVLPLELVDARYYRLDTCFCPLSENEAVFFPGAFDDYGRKVLRQRIPNLIEAAADEAVSFSCNAVVVGRHVVLNEEMPRLSRSLREAGYEVHPVRLTEFIKAGGSAKCLTLRLDGEDAASWARRPAPEPAHSPDTSIA